MDFKRIKPEQSLANMIECYWLLESDTETSYEQRIIPDGYPEIIFHFADVYQINLTGQWETQDKSLVAGQIRQFFQLRNTGRASIFGVKLKPTALTGLFAFDISKLTDRVVPIHECKLPELNELEKVIRLAANHDDRLGIANRFFSNYQLSENSATAGVDWIFNNQGCGIVQALCNVMNTSERQVERIFQKHVGLSPKFFSRIVRFNAIFQLLEQGKPGWAEIAYEAGFADQSHFIRDFKAFTGAEPSMYGFDEKTLANFFLKKRL